MWNYGFKRLVFQVTQEPSVYEQRWYDKRPTMAMAISLLLNTSPRIQDQVTSFLYEQIVELNPFAIHQVIDGGGFLWFNRRTSMSRRTWMVIESMQFLEETDCFELSRSIIEVIYALENETAALA